jgi:hypothetical protein
MKQIWGPEAVTEGDKSGCLVKSEVGDGGAAQSADERQIHVSTRIPAATMSDQLQIRIALIVNAAIYPWIIIVRIETLQPAVERNFANAVVHCPPCSSLQNMQSEE